MAAEAIGWRVWRLHGDVLRSPLNGVAWPPRRPLEARCLDDRCSVSPGRNCDCGIWATRRHVPFWIWHRSLLAQEYVVGLIQLWGEVAVHGTEGWRGQYARPLLLLTTELRRASPDLDEWRRYETVVERVAGAYGIPAVSPLRRGWQAVARELGAPDVSWVQERLGHLAVQLHSVRVLGAPRRYVCRCLFCGYGPEVRRVRDAEQLAVGHQQVMAARATAGDPAWLEQRPDDWGSGAR